MRYNYKKKLIWLKFNLDFNLVRYHYYQLVFADIFSRALKYLYMADELLLDE